MWAASCSQRCDAAVCAASMLVYGVLQGRQSVAGAAFGKAAGLWLALLMTVSLTSGWCCCA